MLIVNYEPNRTCLISTVVNAWKLVLQLVKLGWVMFREFPWFIMSGGGLEIYRGVFFLPRYGRPCFFTTRQEGMHFLWHIFPRMFFLTSEVFRAFNFSHWTFIEGARFFFEPRGRVKFCHQSGILLSSPMDLNYGSSLIFIYGREHF